MSERPPRNFADHAEEFARRYAEDLDWYCTIRMQELGIPEDDAIVAHEWEESKTADHIAALKTAPETELRITEGARRILKAMARGAGRGR